MIQPVHGLSESLWRDNRQREASNIAVSALEHRHLRIILLHTIFHIISYISLECQPFQSRNSKAHWVFGELGMEDGCYDITPFNIPARNLYSLLSAPLVGSGGMRSMETLIQATSR